MITQQRELMKPGITREFLNLEAVYGQIPKNLRFHMQRVVRYCDIMTKYIEREIAFINSIEREFYANANDVFKYHDIGYAFVPLELFGKDEEIREHVEFAKEAFDSVVYMNYDKMTKQHARECAVYHHENFDGSGYPEGLKGEEIPFAARICAIADMYDHLVTENPYYLKEGNDEIVAAIVKESGKRFQPQLVNVLVNCAERFKKQDILIGNYKK